MMSDSKEVPSDVDGASVDRVVMRREVFVVVMNAYQRIHEKHSYALNLLAENTGVEKPQLENCFPLDGFAFAQGKEASCRDAIGIFDDMIRELRQLSDTSA